MVFPTERPRTPDFQSKFEQKTHFEAALDEGLAFYRAGLYSPGEFIRSLTSTFGKTEALIIDQFRNDIFPANVLIVTRAYPEGKAPQIEIHDPSSDLNSREYPSVVLAADEDNLIPLEINYNQSNGHQRSLPWGPNTDEVGRTIIEKFQSSTVFK